MKWSEDRFRRKRSVKPPARIAQDRFLQTGEASRYPEQPTTPALAAAGEKNKDHKEVVETPGIDPPSNRGNLSLCGAQISAGPLVTLGCGPPYGTPRGPRSFKVALGGLVDIRIPVGWENGAEGDVGQAVGPDAP